DMAVTTQFNFNIPNGDGTFSSETLAPFGGYSDVIDGNVNTGTGPNPQSHDLEEVYGAGTEISILGKSWKKKRSSSSGNKASHWTTYMEVDSMDIDGSPSALANVMILTNGQEVPNIEGYLDQGDVEDFLNGYIDEDGKVTIADDQAIVLFELGTTNLTSAAADFQDLVVLMTFVEQ
ncbi:MAG: hypothetical protein HRT88_09225, partial [Lentisphaeraceae bacterium]|nr:hypothetical protein [Lentisphaeraceae bacterium]